MSKHTPGPWEQGEICKEHIWGLKDNVPVLLASAHTIGDSIQTSERTANARLIAAAPELLEALQGMVGWWEKDGGSMDEYIERSKAAITKATRTA